MSDGKCQDTCQNAYAYAILQGYDCWCSNFAPASLQDTGKCNQQCPGYPSDWCGNTASGLYGYYSLTIAPSGTAGPQSSSVSTALGTSNPTSPELLPLPRFDPLWGFDLVVDCCGCVAEYCRVEHVIDACTCFECNHNCTIHRFLGCSPASKDIFVHGSFAVMFADPSALGAGEAYIPSQSFLGRRSKC